MRVQSWLGWALGAGLLTVAGCEVSVGHCDRDDAGHCFDDEFPFGMDAARPDASVGDGGGRSDASVAKSDGGMDAGSLTDAGGRALSVEQFCQAQLAMAVAWRDLFDSVACGCARDNTVEAMKRADFLGKALGYSGNDPESACITARSGSITAGNVTFSGGLAEACARKFAGQFTAPPASCPVDLTAYEAQLAHGVQQPVQLAECRAAFAGKVVRDQPCTAADSLECVAGLRCLPVVGSLGQDAGVMRTCQPSRVEQQSCERLAECADGLVCSGVTGARVCIARNVLRAQNAACLLSLECLDGLVCRGDRCVPPTADLVCTR